MIYFWLMRSRYGLCVNRAGDKQAMELQSKPRIHFLRFVSIISKVDSRLVMDRHADTSARDDKRGILCVIASGDCACASIFMLSLRENPQGFSWQSIFH